jgi:hypothetical protein
MSQPDLNQSRARKQAGSAGPPDFMNNRYFSTAHRFLRGWLFNRTGTT